MTGEIVLEAGEPSVSAVLDLEPVEAISVPSAAETPEPLADVSTPDDRQQITDRASGESE